MGKNARPANLVETGFPYFEAAANLHIMNGDNHNGTGAHSGLHSMTYANQNFAGKVIAEIDRDKRVNDIYVADVKLRGNKASKRSSFFPASMAWPAVKSAIEEAWQDYKTYHTVSEVYSQIANKYNLPWVGYATIQGKKIWIGSLSAGTQGNPIDTAFPAVNNKFYAGITGQI